MGNNDRPCISRLKSGRDSSASLKIALPVFTIHSKQAETRMVLCTIAASFILAALQANVGRLYCDFIYIPFKDSQSDVKTDDPEDEIKATEANAKDPHMKAVTNAFSKITDEDKGILTLTLKGCSNLQVSISSWLLLQTGCKYTVLVVA